MKAHYIGLNFLEQHTDHTLLEIEAIACQGDTKQIESIILSTVLKEVYDFEKYMIIESHTKFGTRGTQGVWTAKKKSVKKAMKKWWKNLAKSERKLIIKKQKNLVYDEYMDSLEKFYKETGEIAILLRKSDRPEDMEAYCRYSVEFFSMFDDFIIEKGK